MLYLMQHLFDQISDTYWHFENKTKYVKPFLRPATLKPEIWKEVESRASPVVQTVKNLPAIQKTRFRSLSQEDSLEMGIATHSSVFAWRIPRTEELGEIQSVHGVAKSWTWLSD